jgi:NSS family neurotransmitter:Na+ symporter
MDKIEKRESFVSQFGIIMVAVGSAVGLGNIWRFSYILGINGGGAFLLVYILCVVFVGLPVMISELTIGRSSGLSTLSAFQKLAPKTPWWIAGAVPVLASVVIACYYPTVSGWSLGYVFECIFNWDRMLSDPGVAFGEFSAGWKAYLFAAAALAITVGILLRGVTEGIEKVSKFLMPLLAVIMIVLVIRSVTLPGAQEGIRFLFYPDFSQLSVGGFLDALGHSFYSLSLGMGILITYASYMKKDANLVSATISIVTMDTVIAVLAGLAIFPAVFAMGLDPAEGASLAFITLPGAFARIPFGQIFAALFFLLIFIAALTSMMSILQVPLALLEDKFGLSRRKGLAIVSAISVLCGIPSVMAFGLLKDFTIMGMDYFTFLDKFANNILLPISALLGCMFIVFSMGIAASRKEFLLGAKHESHFLASVYPFAIKFLAPAAIVVILLNAAGLFS